MSPKRILSVILSLCLLLTLFATVPSARAHAMNAEVVVVTSGAAAVRQSPSPSAAQKTSAALNNSFHITGSQTGSDGVLWYSILYSSNISGWISSADVDAVTACSSTVDPHTTYLKRMAQVTVEKYTLRTGPGDQNPAVATVSKNERMVVLGYSDDGAGKTWYEVRYGDANGWIIRTAAAVHNHCISPGSIDCAKKLPVIYLSPSRQPHNPFAAGNTNECEQMTRVAVSLKAILESRYDCIVYLADYATPITKFNRPYEAYRLGADIYLAIHSNATGTSSKVNGTQAYYYPGSAQNKLMADNLVSSISAIAPFPDDVDRSINGMTYLNGVGYGEVRDPGGFGMQSILLEVEFHDKADSAKWIINNTDNIAAAIADGLHKTYHFLPKGTFTTTTTTTTTTTPSSTVPTVTTTAAPIADGYNPLGTTRTTTTAATSAITTTTTSATATTAATAATTDTTAATTASTETTTTTTAPEVIPARILRAGGKDRVDTAAKISAMGWESADTVIIASGSSYPDALAGVPLSAAADAPILLTTGKTGAEPLLMSELARLGAKNAYILGGESAVSSDVQRDLAQAGIVCTRLAGNDRYATCVLIAQELARLAGKPCESLFFVSADNFPDALAISPVAAIEGSPILYIGSKSEIKPTVAQLVTDSGCTSAYLTGGESSVSAAGKASIERMGISVERISGKDRYATGLAIAARFAGIFEGSGVALATGKNFPDALAGGGHAAKQGVPVLLVGDDVSADMLSFVSVLSKGDVYVYGGTNTVSDKVAQTVLAVME